VRDSVWEDGEYGLKARADDAVLLYGEGLTLQTFPLQSAVDSTGSPLWEVGSLLTATHPRVVHADGRIDESAPPVLDLLVTGREVDDRTRTESMTALLLGYAATQMVAPTWAPVARIKSVSLPFVTIATNEFTDAAAEFGPVIDVGVWDVVPSGAALKAQLRHGNTMATLGTVDVISVTAATHTLKLDGYTVTPEDGMLVTLTEYDTQEAWVHALTYDEDHGGPPAFGASSDGELGASGDDGQRYG
jgi:hypothetical protein